MTSDTKLNISTVVGLIAIVVSVTVGIIGFVSGTTLREGSYVQEDEYREGMNRIEDRFREDMRRNQQTVIDGISEIKDNIGRLNVALRDERERTQEKIHQTELKQQRLVDQLDFLVAEIKNWSTNHVSKDDLRALIELNNLKSPMTEPTLRE